MTNSGLLQRGREIDDKFYRAHVSLCQEDATVQFAVLWHAYYVMVLFPPSRGPLRQPNDWIRGRGNTNAKKKTCFNVEVHADFSNQVDSLWDELLRQIDLEADKKIVCAGYSRGGAVAMLSALRLDDDCRLYKVVTFGQPAAVDKKSGKRP